MRHERGGAARVVPLRMYLHQTQKVPKITGYALPLAANGWTQWQGLQATLNVFA